jgi:diguanylate cyclase (GGDEF)-like protein/PAS domain S-box-containing protein
MARVMSSRIDITQGIIAELLRQEQKHIRGLISQLARYPANDEDRLLKRVLSVDEGDDLFYLLDQNGRVCLIADPYRQHLGLDFSHLAFIAERKPVSGVHQSLVTRQSVISFLSEMGDGRLLVLEKRLQEFLPLFAQLEQGEMIPEEQLFVLAGDGTVIYHPNPELVRSRHNLGLELRNWQGPDLNGLYRFDLGREHSIGVQRTLDKPSGWRLYYSAPFDLLTDTVLQEIAVQFVVLASVFFAAFAALGWLLQRYYSNPLANVARFLSDYRLDAEGATVPASSARGIRELSLLIGAVNDMTEKIRSTTRQLEDKEELFRTVTEYSVHWAFWLHPDGGLRYIAPTCERITGYSPEAFYRQPALLHDIIHPEDRALWENHRHETDSQGELLPMEFRILTKSGETRCIRHYCRPIISKTGVNLGNRGTNIDITEEKQAEQQLIRHSLYDALTELANRNLFLDRLEHAIARCGRGEYQFAVLFFDLDRFKTVNDSLGHCIGDCLLQQVAQRLLDESRPGDTVARLGGDEFAALLEDVKDMRAALHFAERAQARMREPFRVESFEVFCTISIGVTLSRGQVRSAEDLLRDADTAMYHAKSQGRDRIEVFGADMHAKAVARLSLDTDLRRAVERREFINHYQPIVDLRSMEISGFEALIRWRHPEKGMVPPGEFISLAEETGLILPMGEAVLECACHDLQCWQVEQSKSALLSMNVNLSAVQLARTDLLALLTKLLDRYAVSAASLTLEITESVLMEHTGQMRDTLERIQALDVGLCMDDFGTGYSSLTNLRRFPIGGLKIDQTFIAAMLTREDDRKIVHTIIDLAHNLGIHCVAEGVENEQQLAELKRLGCDYAQGFLFSKAVDAERALAMIQGLSPRRSLGS